MPLFHRREETLNEKLLREAGYSSEGAPTENADVVEPSDVEEHDDRHEVTFPVKAPDLTGSAYDFVTLPDGSVLVDEDAPNLSDLADAVELHFPPPYRASAARQADDYWLVHARPIRIGALALSGEEAELSFVNGVRTFVVDGNAADAGRVPSELITLGEEQEGSDFVVRATRLDGDLWEIVADPL